MRVAVSYQGRTYGNSTWSTASEISIGGSAGSVYLSVNFKEPQPGRSWDWMSSASVGGATIEMRLADARALAEALLNYVLVRESAPEGNIVEATLRLCDGAAPESRLRNQTLAERNDEMRKLWQGR